MGTRIQTAMIIDDDADLGKVLSYLLEERRIHAMTVHSLTEAEECLTYLKPSVIFLDNSFPEGLGVNFIKNIRTADEEIKIIMMTGDSDQWIEEKAMNEGANYFLKKPFSKEKVNTTLDALDFRK